MSRFVVLLIYRLAYNITYRLSLSKINLVSGLVTLQGTRKTQPCLSGRIAVIQIHPCEFKISSVFGNMLAILPLLVQENRVNYCIGEPLKQ